ncbi:HepT-like ribonuclease domain-containing protein [Gloeocapsa sp. PCC 7428]|nr:HepT-like ribonuclease domain-containing protein [Gloeocapsa sp. PCC 7428]
MVHEYWGVDVAVVWSTVEEGISPLKAVITEIRQSF